MKINRRIRQIDRLGLGERKKGKVGSGQVVGSEKLASCHCLL